MVGKGKLSRTDLIDVVAWLCMAGYGLGCIIFSSSFAEYNIKFAQLNFPIFLGEMLIALCLILLWQKNNIKPIIWTDACRRICVVLVIIAIWALFDYSKQHEPLAFRNAAMIYYSIFFIFGYVFFNERLFRMMIVPVAVTAILLSSVILDVGYYWLSCATVFFLSYCLIKNVVFRNTLLVVFLFICNYPLLFCGSRTNLVGSLIPILFCAWVYFAHFWKKSVNKRIWMILVFVIVVIIALFCFADRNSARSLVKIKEVINLYQENDKLVQSRKKIYPLKKLKPTLYRPNDGEDISENLDQARVALIVDQPAAVSTVSRNSNVPARKKESSEGSSKMNEAQGSIPEKQENVRPNAEATDITFIKELERKLEPAGFEISFKERKFRSLTHAQYNAVFRLFIWRDMFEEMIEKHAWFGVGLAHPQRSVSVEMLGWAVSEWQRDGWITPHNTFLHIIYRLGIFGLALIIGLMVFLYRMYKKFIYHKSWPGILLVGMLMYWLVATNFLVILELPYYAIIFWTIFGITAAYLNHISLRSKSCAS